MIAVMYGVLWKCIFSRIKEMEPFFQLTKPGGAKAESSILLSYVDASLPKVFILSALERYGLTLAGAMNSGLVLICTALALEVLYIQTTDSCTSLPNGAGQDCKASLASFDVDDPFAEPTSIVGIATLMKHIDPGFNRDNTQLLTHNMSGIYPDKRYMLTSENEGGPMITVLSERDMGASCIASSAKKKPKRDFAVHPASMIALWLF
ncbi:hypothetical protein EJ08DRAFT_694102 [Tothia fuscella]|uniref:Uncharacterized protein n=1 Tax=Tothia fuscella TaxID=1048955 RepID=A0A9P4U2L7_9PEZI|nr:hypothetical protein EJ08DRAFT_694102 [Tothia fuscella]